MRRSTGYLVVVLGLLAAGAVAAEEPGELSLELPAGGVEIHLPTPPQEQLAGADIEVERWRPGQPASRGLEVLRWVPDAPARIPSPRPYTTPARSWVPGAPSAIPVQTWSPGQPSRIVVHGAY